MKTFTCNYSQCLVKITPILQTPLPGLFEDFQRKTTWILSNRASLKYLDFRSSTAMFQNHLMCFSGRRLALYIGLEWRIRTVDNTWFLKKIYETWDYVIWEEINTQRVGGGGQSVTWAKLITFKIHAYYFCCVLWFTSTER